MTLPSDPESEDQWANMPKNLPSKNALPPLVFGGGRGWMLLLIVLSILAIVGLLLSRGPGL
jgi:hypothetical protein